MSQQVFLNVMNDTSGGQWQCIVQHILLHIVTIHFNVLYSINRIKTIDIGNGRKGLCVVPLPDRLKSRYQYYTYIIPIAHEL